MSINFKSRSVTNTSPFKVTLLVETLASGSFSASVLEFPTCYVEADSQESAVSQLQKNFLDRLQNIQAIDWDIPSKNVSPAWMKYAGVFKDDVDFLEIMEEIQAASSSGDETEVDPSYYL